MKERQEIQKELKDIAPQLVALQGKQSPFKVPANYFEQLEEKVAKKVAPPKEVSKKVFRLPMMLGRIAAIFILLAGGLFFLQKNGLSSTESISLSPAEINGYIADNLDDFDEDLLIQADLSDAVWLDTDINEQEMEIIFEELIDELEDSDLESLL